MQTGFFRGCLCLIAACLVLASGFRAAEDEAKPTPLGREETDAFLERVFEKNEDLSYFTAGIRLTKSGGALKRPNVKSGSVSVQLPDRFLLDLSDSGLRILADGTYAWVHDTDLDDVERWRVETGEGKADAASLGGFALFLGGEAKTPEEIRRRFNVNAFRIGGDTRLLLMPIEKELASRYERFTVSFAKDARLPSLVQTTSKVEKNSNLPSMVTRYELSEIQTNLDGRDKFPPETFVFPLTRDMAVRDMSPPGGGGPEELTYEAAKRDIAENRGKLQEKETPEKAGAE